MYCNSCMNEKGTAAVCPFCHNADDHDTPSHHLRPGTILNRKYLVGCAIGEGGFGITYIGRDMTLDMRVAIKEFYPSGCSNRNSRIDTGVTVSSDKLKQFFEKGKERFLFEARSVAKFSDEKGIVDVRDYFEENGTAYIIMEYLEGMDLNHYLETYGPLPAERAFSLMLPVMRSLEKINSEGIIHRDISPDNVMFCADGTLKLMDFGSARYFLNEDKAMSVMLKQGFAPEEQYRTNGRQGPWTDVYGLCATLYCCITGVIPESGVDRAHEDQLKKPSELGFDISPELEAVLLYGLAVFAENRCQNMTELISLTNKAFLKRPIDAGRPVRHPENNVTYGDEFAVKRHEKSTKEFDPADKANTLRQDEKDKKRGLPTYLIVLICAAAVMLIAGVILLALYGDGIFGAGDSGATKPGFVIQTEPDVTSPPLNQVRVPDVEGLQFEDAIGSLNAEGLTYEIRFLPSSKVKENHVISQDPAPDTYVQRGDTVVLTLAAATDVTESGLPPADNPNICYCIADNVIYLHESPDRTSDFIDQIQYGESVILIEEDGEFLQVIYQGRKGYVLGKFFSKEFGETVCTDIEYRQPKICVLDTFGYVAPSEETIRIPIHVGDEVMLVGLLSDSGFYELVLSGKMIYLPMDDFDRAFSSSAFE